MPERIPARRAHAIVLRPALQLGQNRLDNQGPGSGAAGFFLREGIGHQCQGSNSIGAAVRFGVAISQEKSKVDNSLFAALGRVAALCRRRPRSPFCLYRPLG